MADYLTNYGVADARRGKLLKIALLSTAVLLLALGIWFFFFRHFQEERLVSRFISYLQTKDYQSAYRLWGCSPEKPCPNYTYEKFMEDWGPQSIHRIADQASVVDMRACPTGIVETVAFPSEQVQLYIDSKDRTLSFNPWPFPIPSGAGSFVTKAMGRAGALSCSPTGS